MASTIEATLPTSTRAELVTCQTCDYSVPQAPGKKRTICPNCGHFYSKEGAEIATNYQRNARNAQAHGPNNRQTQQVAQSRRTQHATTQGNQNGNRSGGRISTFFQNLTPNSRRPPSDGRSESLSPSDSVKTELLPPIDGLNRSQLTSRNSSPSYSKSGSRLGVSDGQPGQASPCGDGCIHTKRSSSNLRVEDAADPHHHHHHHHNGSNNSSPRGSYTDVSRSNGSSPSKSGDGTNERKTAEQLKLDFVAAKESGNWRFILEYFSKTFDSFIDVNNAFKQDLTRDYKTTEDPGLNFEYTNLVYDILMKTPQGLQKEVLKAIINSLLKDKRNKDGRIWPHSKDDLRAFLVLIQNPQFHNQSAFVIFAHLLRQVAALSDHDHHYLVHWMKRLKRDKFHLVVQRIHNFISLRLFPPKPEDLPPLAKCSWWIPSATKVLALFNAANNLVHPLVTTYLDFYNSTLDHLDLMAEYYAWQNPSSHAGFSFCQYPFILSISAKRTILQKDSEQQMIIMARKSLVAKVQRRQLPDIGMLFLNLTVRRSHLVSDSLNEIAKKQHDLKKKLKVSFTGEPGLDMGGLTKEWFLLLVRQIFMPNYGMFSYDKRAGVHWFSPHTCENYQEFNLVGVLMGLAVYNSINLDIRFPPVCYRKLLSPAVVPFNNPRATVGVCPVTLHDLKSVDPDVAKGLQDLLDYPEDDVEDMFCLTFEVATSTIGSAKMTSLKPGGENIAVTNNNRNEYVQLYVEWIITNSMYAQFQAFYHGFHSVCASNALIMLRPEEVETLVCGSPRFVMEDLKKVASYDGYSSSTPTIKNFWDVVLSMSKEMQKRLLLFATGSDRIPIGGISEMTFKISRIDDLKLLPMSHTCFNQLVLPPYKGRKVLRQKLVLAISNAEGFGLE